MKIIEGIIYKFYQLQRIENLLLKCQSYEAGTIPLWKKQTNLRWREALKILNAIEIFDASRIRQIIHDTVEANKEIFQQGNVYITSFGSEGKSGGKIAYEFRHTNLVSETIFKSSWEIADLPSNSTIIFVEDIIGTGKQSTDYITNKLNLLLKPSHNPYLLTVCATPEGISKVENETNFQVIHGILLERSVYQHYSEECTYFNQREKNKIKEINNRLKRFNAPDFDCGLLVTFFYSPPNNSMPLLWKHKYQYADRKGKNKEWIALIPRNY